MKTKLRLLAVGLVIIAWSASSEDGRHNADLSEQWHDQKFWQSARLRDIRDKLAQGLNPDARAKNGMSPLHGAALLTKNPAVVAALVQAGADVDARDKYGKSPLHAAVAFNNNPAVIMALLEAGANPKARDYEGKIAFDLIQDNDELKDTDIYWQLNNLQYQ